MSWWTINNREQIDTPALVIYPERVKENIRILKSMAKELEQLRPHIKTNKSPEACNMLLEAGIRKFKCATIAEAEMLAGINAPDVLLAYQPTGPKVIRLAELIKKFPATTFSCLTDNMESAAYIGRIMTEANLTIRVFVDLNVGMNRTGITPEQAFGLFQYCLSVTGIEPAGLHAYDGHLRDEVLSLRKEKCDTAFRQVEHLRDKIKNVLKINPIIIAGGSPTFPIHIKRENVECSPGTFIYWDSGYGSILKEQPFLFSALVLTRIISKPSEGLLCLDLGHKSIASENPMDKRVTFLNGTDLIPVSQSEEHLVVRTNSWNEYQIGDLIYGLPYHVCPTIALYDYAWIVTDGKTSAIWSAVARNRKLSV
ncbi:MAG: D-TA family PLP-dependent enzyme [Cyclobacteriaceae bacterium]